MERNFDNNYIEYAPILQRYGLLPKVSWPWLKIGNKNGLCKWTLYLSVATKQGLDLLEWVIPILIQAKVGFRIVKNQSLHYKLNCGYFGTKEQAKAISIYPRNERNAFWLVWKLRKGASIYKGPTIPAAKRLANILHTDDPIILRISVAHGKRRTQCKKITRTSIIA